MAVWMALGAVPGLCWAGAQGKKVVEAWADLPSFSYSLSQPPSVFLDSADDATFLAFARKVESDTDSVLTGYVIEDKAILRALLGCKEEIAKLRGNWEEALSDAERIRVLQDKPEEKQISGLQTRVLVAAYKETNAISGPAFDAAYKAHFAEELHAMPWASVQGWANDERQSDDMLTPTILAGVAKADLDPQFARTGSLDPQGANLLIALRFDRRFPDV